MTSAGQIPQSAGSGNVGSNLMMAAKNARGAQPDLAHAMEQNVKQRANALRRHNVPPAEVPADATKAALIADRAENTRTGVNALPSYYNTQWESPAIPHDVDSEQKERMRLKAAIRDAANQDILASTPANQAPGVIRTQPITEEEVDYLASMKDKVELAKFDEYVEAFIDPRKPGNMEWLMKIYPGYVERRLQQTHTDYEFALRNHMIDQWGMNTFDDLFFKYMVDQKEISGPRLSGRAFNLNASWAPGYLSFFNFQNRGDNFLRLPYSSANIGPKPRNDEEWGYDRSGRPLGNGTDTHSLARGMYDTARPANNTAPAGRAPGGETRLRRGMFNNAPGGIVSNP